ncbi:MAG TPA: hypothetical protein VMX75_11800, partial [Spirochaetia bacterium]|nr:hypothetical protein [Spirochaetia bacterium]
MRSYISVVLGRGRCESWIDFLKESAYDTVKLKHVNRYEEIMYQNRERVARILSHQPADRVPYCAVTDPPIPRLVDEMGLDPGHRSFCLDGDFAFILIEPAVDRSAFEPYFDQIPEDTEFSIWGVGRERKQTDAGWHAGYRMFHPLAHIDSIEELRRYPFPDIASSAADRGLEQKVKALKGRGYTVLGQMSQTILETAYEMRGMLKL